MLVYWFFLIDSTKAALLVSKMKNQIIQNTNDKNFKELKKFSKILFEQQQKNSCRLPSKNDIAEIVHDLLQLLFPMHYNKKLYHDLSEVEQDLLKIYNKLKKIMIPFLNECPSENEKHVDDVIYKFASELPRVYQYLLEDAEASFHGDPAAQSPHEIILAYPGFYAIAVHRLANIFYNCEVPIFPRMLSEHAHGKTGIDIHPGASIGRSFFIDHGTGVVIGETCNIGNKVKIYQGVTLGALSVEKKLARKKRHPTIEDNVVIYAGATILGGETVIGHDSVIGGNVWITQSLPSYSVIYYKSDSKVRSSRELDNIIDFCI